MEADSLISQHTLDTLTKLKQGDRLRFTVSLNYDKLIIVSFDEEEFATLMESYNSGSCEALDNIKKELVRKLRSSG